MRRSKTEEADVVVALRFDLDAVADDLARWCEGSVVLDDPLDPTSPAIAIRVPTPDGSALAEAGDWIVRHLDGSCVVMSDSSFRARHEPLA